MSTFKNVISRELYITFHIFTQPGWLLLSNMLCIKCMNKWNSHSSSFDIIILFHGTYVTFVRRTSYKEIKTTFREALGWKGLRQGNITRNRVQSGLLFVLLVLAFPFKKWTKAKIAETGTKAHIQLTCP